MFQSSYCIGEAGRNVKSISVPESISNEQLKEDTVETKLPDGSSSSSSDEEPMQSSKKRKEKKTNKLLKSKEKKVVEKESDHTEAVELDERKRPYNSMYDIKQPTEEEMEQYYRKRRRDDDPMNQFL